MKGYILVMDDSKCIRCDDECIYEVEHYPTIQRLLDAHALSKDDKWDYKHRNLIKWSAIKLSNMMVIKLPGWRTQDNVKNIASIMESDDHDDTNKYKQIVKRLKTKRIK